MRNSTQSVGAAIPKQSLGTRKVSKSEGLDSKKMSKSEGLDSKKISKSKGLDSKKMSKSKDLRLRFQNFKKRKIIEDVS